jgi:hypothetical protein
MFIQVFPQPAGFARVQDERLYRHPHSLRWLFRRVECRWLRSRDLRGEGLSGRLIETRLLSANTQRFIEFLREQLQDA